MDWITIIENSNWRIRTNALLSDAYTFFRWGKSFIEVTCKNYASESWITFFDNKFNFYYNNDVSVIEITDEVRTLVGGTLSFVSASGTITEIDYVCNDGERPEDYNFDYLPSVVPVTHYDQNAFFIQIIPPARVFDGSNWSSNISSIQAIDARPYTLYRDVKSGRITQLIEVDCVKNKVMLTWTGHFGVKKSWWFDVKSEIDFSNKSISLQSLDDNYSVMRNKLKSLVLLYPDADYMTQRYISDIVHSDSVEALLMEDTNYVFSVEVDNDSFESSRKRRDISLTIKTFNYDTV